MPFRLPPDDKLPPIQPGNPRPGPGHWGVYNAIKKIPEGQRTPTQAQWFAEFESSVLPSRSDDMEATELPSLPVIQNNTPPPPIPPTRPKPPRPPTAPSHASEGEASGAFGRSATTGRGKTTKITREVIEEQESMAASTEETAPTPPPVASVRTTAPFRPPVAGGGNGMPPRPPVAPNRYSMGDEEDDDIGKEEGFADEGFADNYSEGPTAPPSMPRMPTGGPAHPQLPDHGTEVLPADGSIPASRKKDLDPIVATLLEQVTSMTKHSTYLSGELKLMARQSTEESRKTTDMISRQSEKFAQLAHQQSTTAMQVAHQMSEVLQQNNVNNINLTTQMIESAISLMTKVTESQTKLIETLDKRINTAEDNQIKAMKQYAEGLRKEAVANAVLEGGVVIEERENHVEAPTSEEGEGQSEMDKMMGNVLQNGLQTGIANAVGAGIDKAMESIVPRIMQMFAKPDPPKPT